MNEILYAQCPYLDIRTKYDRFWPINLANINIFITLGFEKKLLLNRYKYIDNKHGISNKFKLACELQCILTDLKFFVMVNFYKGAVFYII